jgi:tRNA(Ile)-lysidine synthase
MLDQTMIEPQGRYVVAVSGGPDSMALLMMMVDQTKNLMVAHVDYQVRPTSGRDRHIVEETCKKLGIPLRIYYAPPAPQGRNFQSWAREERYRFFQELVQEFKADALLIAHQQDDLLESFWMKRIQKRATRHVSIAERAQLYQMKVLRPLWQVSRADLRSYCLTNKIPFGDDETNATPAYERNRVRQHLAQFSKEERHQLLREMQEAEAKAQAFERTLAQVYASCLQGRQMYLPTFCAQSSAVKQALLLRYLGDQQAELMQVISPRFYAQVSRQLCGQKANVTIPYGRHGLVRKTYDWIEWVQEEKKEELKPIIMETVTSTRFGNWRIQTEGPAKLGIGLLETDFPLTIRQWLPGDRVMLQGGHKKVGRLFIDAKLPPHERHSIPLLFNHEGTLLFIPGLYKENMRKRLQSTLYMVK